MRNAAIGLVILMALAANLPSAAHEHATGIVKERMDAMTVMDKRVRAIVRHVRSHRDLASIKADAETIASHAAHIAHLFPNGSMQPPTRARRTIWQNWADFEEKAKALETASRALAATKPDNAAALGAAVQAMTRTCDACHETYRTRK
jgi:cytochrome c556